MHTITTYSFWKRPISRLASAFAFFSRQTSAVGEPAIVRPLLVLLVSALLGSLTAVAAEFQEPIVLESPNAQVNGYFGAEGDDWVPDVNGDGIPDIIVSALGEGPPGSPASAGRVYVFDGATREVLTELKSPQEKYEGCFGWKIAGIEDLNGNGSGDVIVVTETENRAYVLDGKTGEVIHTIVEGGDSVSAVPDVNRDGLDDFVVGDHINPNTPGYARIYDGASGVVLRTINAPGGSHDFFGWCVSGVPDVNGNGGGDVVVGNWGNGGQAYIYDGTTGALLHILNPPYGESGDFGRSLAGLEDINGDGRGDVIVGASSGGSAAYLFDGARGILLRTINQQWTGTYSWLGWVVSALPDVTGDGLTDFIVSGHPGLSGDDALVIDTSTGNLLASLPGDHDFGGGGSMVGIPDVNGDGLGEVLVANWSATSSGGYTSAGHVLLYLSKAPPAPPSLQLMGLDAQSSTIRINAPSNSSVEIQATSDFQTWEPVTNVVADGNPVEVKDPAASNHTQRFYRAVKSN